MALNCPVCGAPAPEQMQFAKLLVCSSCKTSLFLEDNAVKHAGVKSVVIEQPSLFSVGQTYRYRSMTFETYGRVQFDYGGGYWDEWWVVNSRGVGMWVSVDEGDIAIESPMTLKSPVPSCDSLEVGASINLDAQNLLVTEKNSCKCVALEGQLPEVIFPGDEHDYAHLSGHNGVLFTLECFGDDSLLFKGSWIDPFDIKPLGYDGVNR
ncbi:MAG: DUF4178 domain-containing protein [Gammaproteobacteria bacterium]|nr:DUF4178 domain-containing protein [Gammaproteobacteria bacterium]MDH5803206.1 DUF4178 domain-containing protein [Gammaproteobacteria bacterium]